VAELPQLTVAPLAVGGAGGVHWPNPFNGNCKMEKTRENKTKARKERVGSSLVIVAFLDALK
jgi:hypothetical protein